MFAPGAVALAVSVLVLLFMKDSPEKEGFPPIDEGAPKKKVAEEKPPAGWHLLCDHIEPGLGHHHEVCQRLFDMLANFAKVPPAKSIDCLQRIILMVWGLQTRRTSQAC